MGTVLEHVRLQIAHRTRTARRGESPEGVERAAIRELRRHLLWYTRGRRGGVHFRRDADKLLTAADVTALLEHHFPPGDQSFELDPGSPWPQAPLHGRFAYWSRLRTKSSRSFWFTSR